MATTKKSAGKSMDVMKPGATTPESTGRPIIVTNRPIMQDPMVKEADTSDDKAAEETTPKGTVSSGSSKVIAPLGSQEKTDEATPAAETDETSDDSDKPEVEAISSIPTPEEEQAQAAVVDAVVASAGSNQSPEQQEQIAQDERHQRVQKLVESKKYVVPIGQVSRKKLHQQLFLLVGLAVVVFGAYLAADMGYIPLPFELPVHILKR